MSVIQDKLKKLSPRSQTLLILIFPAVVAGLFFYSVYIPYNSKIKDLAAKVQQNESEISKSQVMERKLNELKAANQKLQAELKAATERLPSGAEEATLPETITEMARSSGLTFKSITPGERKPGPGGLYTQSAYAVEVSGGYHEVGKFMENMGKMTRVIAISDLNMSAAKIDGKSMNIPVKFTVLAFTAGGGK